MLGCRFILRSTGIVRLKPQGQRILFRVLCDRQFYKGGKCPSFLSSSPLIMHMTLQSTIGVPQSTSYRYCCDGVALWFHRGNTDQRLTHWLQATPASCSGRIRGSSLRLKVRLRLPCTTARGLELTSKENRRGAGAMTSAIFHDGYSVARAVPCAWHLRNKLARMADRTSGSQTLAEEWIRKILTVLHLARQQEAKGARLPPALDLFVKDLTGRATTTPAGTSFNARLERSVEHALRYLDGSSEWTEIAPGVSTAEVEDAVRDLLEQITAPAVAESP